MPTPSDRSSTSPRPRRGPFVIGLLGLAGLAAVGCDGPVAGRPVVGPAEVVSTGSETPAPEAAPADGSLVGQWYERIEIDGHLVGRNHVLHEHIAAAGPPAAGDAAHDAGAGTATAGAGPATERYTGRTVMSLRRFGQGTTMRLTQVSEETADGHVVAFRTIVDQGDGPVTTSARRDGDRFRLTVSGPPGGAPSERTSVLEVPADVGGFFAVEQSLARDPLPPGGTRTLDVLVPMLHLVGRVTLTRAPGEPADGDRTAGDRADTDGPAGRPDLHTVDAVLAVAGTELASTYHVDGEGTVWRTVVPTAKQATVRVDRAQYILAGQRMEGPGGDTPGDPGDRPQMPPTEAYDLGLATLLPVEGDLAGLAAQPAATYRVTLDPGPPFTFPTTDAQSVRDTADPAVVDVAVRSVAVPTARPAAAADAGGPTAWPEAARVALEPGPMIQSDDPRFAAIVAERRAALGDVGPAALATDLTRYVHDRLTIKDFSRAFASATEVLARPEGDCTEHAVLLAALLRAAGLPARVAVGLVVLPDRSAMAYHMWTEAYLDGVWVGLDATRPGPGVGPDRLTVLTSDLSQGGGYAALLPVINLLGRMHVSVSTGEPLGPRRPAPP